MRLISSLSKAVGMQKVVDSTFMRCYHDQLPTKKEASKKAIRTLDKLYQELKAQRFEDVVVIETRFDADPRYMILASAFNARHLVNGTDMLNRSFKREIMSTNDDYANLSISPEWNVVDFKSVVVHLFSKDCRHHYDIEQLWAVGEKHDRHVRCAVELQRETSEPVERIASDGLET